MIRCRAEVLYVSSLPRGTLVRLLLATLACACAESPEGSRWTVRDSAGVEIVSSAGNAPRWDLGDPLLLLGTVDDPGPTQFHRVRDVELLQDGGLVVANQGSEELRIFSADGTFRASVGGKGHGPQEFDGLALVESFADSLLTWDGGNQRITVRLLDGTFMRSFHLEWFEGILFPADLLGAGAFTARGILAVTARYMSQLQGSGLVIDSALVSVYDMEGTLVDSLLRLPHNARAVLRAGNLQTTLGAPYTVGASLVGTEDGFCSTFGPEPEIRCRDRTGLRRLIRADLPRRALNEADVELYWREALETASEAQRSALLRMRDMMPFPEEFPSFAQLVRDDHGRIWARRYWTPTDTREEWLVFDDGRWIGTLASPIGFRVMDIRGDRLAGIWQDSLGVEYVRVYRYRVAMP